MQKQEFILNHIVSTLKHRTMDKVGFFVFICIASVFIMGAGSIMGCAPIFILGVSTTMLSMLCAFACVEAEERKQEKERRAKYVSK